MKIVEDIGMDIAKAKSIGATDLVGRIDLAERIAVKLWYLSEEVGNAHSASNTAEFFYKSAVTSYEASFQGAVSKGAVLARDTHKDLYHQSIDAENYYQKIRFLRDAGWLVVEQLRQSCSFLKQEQYDSRR
jgi:hypothetical protein